MLVKKIPKTKNVNANKNHYNVYTKNFCPAFVYIDTSN